MKNWRCRFAWLMSMVLLLGFSSCTQPPAENSDASQSGQTQAGLTLCAVVTEQEIEQYANELYASCHGMPEVLAVTMSGFPIAAQAATGLDDVDALSLDYVLSWDENGEVVQKQLLETLKALLSGSRTTIELYTFTGEVKIYGLEQIKDVEKADDSEHNPRSTQIKLYDFDCEETKILKVAVNYEDSTQEVGYFSTTDYFRIVLDT